MYILAGEKCALNGIGFSHYVFRDIKMMDWNLSKL